jgi:hypothetical protein
VKALEMNPSMWCAFEKLAKMGDSTIIPSRMFNDSKFRAYQQYQAQQQQILNPAGSTTNSFFIPKDNLFQNPKET